MNTFLTTFRTRFGSAGFGCAGFGFIVTLVTKFSIINWRWWAIMLSALLMALLIRSDKRLENQNEDWPRPPQHVLNDGTIAVDQYEVDRWQIQLRRILAKTVPHFGYGECECCRLPWWIVEGHVVNYNERSGCFPVCEMCWKALGPQEALPYYIGFMEQTHPGDEIQLEQLRNAIIGTSHLQPMPPEDKWWEKE